MSTAFRNESWDAGLDHRVEPASDLNPVDLVNGSFWNLRDVVILASSIQSFRGGKDGRSTLDPPGEQNLGRGQSGLPGDGQNCRIFQWAGAYSMTQWRKCQKNNALLLAEFQQLRLRQIRMRFNLDHRRFDPCGLIERHQVFKHDVGQSNGSALTSINQIFHCSPGLQQSDAAVIM